MSTDRTIAFVDLAGFTALTETHGDLAAVDLIDMFTGIATTAIEGTGTELVKTIGDAVMLAAATPDSAIIAVQRLFEAAYDLGGFPEPRAGLHHGSVVARGDDFFGATVNLAARVASRAGSGQALVTNSMLSAAHDADIDTVSLGLHQLRNILEPVELWALELCPTHIDLSRMPSRDRPGPPSRCRVPLLLSPLHRRFRRRPRPLPRQGSLVTTSTAPEPPTDSDRGNTTVPTPQQDHTRTPPPSPTLGADTRP
jgi:class 3 adenylate cyclase